MTEYGRGPGSQPWHPEDPLYGDQVWDGEQPAAQQGGWDGYGGAQYPQQYGQDPYGQNSYGQDPYGQGQYSQDPYGQDPYSQDPYGQQQGQGQGQHQHYQHDPYGQPQQPQHPQQFQHHPQQGHGQGDPYGQDPYGQQQGQYGGGWNGGQGGDPSYGGATDPYGMQPVDPYSTGRQPAYQDPRPADPYGDAYAAQNAHRPPRPEQRQHPPGPPGGPRRADVDPETGWDPGPDQGESAFFSGDDDDDDRDDYDDDPGRPGRRGGTKRKKGGCACLIVALVLGGGLATVGYFGYQFYESRFGEAPDFSGEGKGEVQVRIPEGSSLTDMGAILEEKGVVKSRGAFIAASKSNAKAPSIQAGVYVLRKEMSGAAAIEMMLDPASQSGLIVPEGRRASEIYVLIDESLGEEKGTTEKAAAAGGLGLPKWAEGKVEGFLFPSKYSVGEETTSKDVLKKMVQRAEAEYKKIGLEDKAEKAGMSPREIIIVASLVEAEAQEKEDFGKVSRVIYNRLEKDMKLQFDSTINYAKGDSELKTSVEDTKFESPYNTYLHQGLPPGPIDNPGHHAIESALQPTDGKWLYFVSVKPGDTRFTDSHAEHQKNVQDFNEYQRNKDNG